MKMINNEGETLNDYTREDVYNGDGYYYININILQSVDFDKIMMTDVINTMSARYTCLRPPGAAGAALVTMSGAVVYGDVRPADGSPTCKDVGCMMEDGHCVRTIHAEVRAILNAAKFGLTTQHAVMYSILKPCFQCTKAIIAAGITKIVFAGAAYDEVRTRDIVNNAPNLSLYQLDANLPYAQELCK